MNTTAVRRFLSLVGLIGTFAFVGAAQNFAVGQPESGVPFVAALTGTAVLDLNNAEARCSSEGIATELGRTTSECTAVLDLANYRPYDECAGEGTGFGLPNVNTMTLTAANGDRLVLVSDDLACEIVQLTSFHGTGVWSVDSAASTGRFAGAVGTGELDGNVDFFAGTVRVGVIGRIRY